MPPRDLGLSVVIPGLNEEANVRDAVERSLEILKGLAARYEVVIVDDGSTDGTAAVAQELQREHPEVRLLRNPLNLGVGTSLLIGLRAATGDLVVHNAMDLPFDLKDLERILPLFPEWDVVAVVRTDRSAHSSYRKLTSLVHHYLVRLLFRTKLRDLNFVQVYKREVLRAVSVKARSPAFVTPELLIRAGDQGFRVTAAGAPFHPRVRGQASHGKPRDILWTLADMLSFWLERRAGAGRPPEDLRRRDGMGIR